MQIDNSIVTFSEVLGIMGTASKGGVLLLADH
jgi:hypothetical protein